MIKKIAAVFLLLFVCSVSSLSAEEAVKKYPPYPDVWGVELPVSESVDYAALRVVKMPDGDYMVVYARAWVKLKEKEKAKYIGYLVFSGASKDFKTDDEYNKFFEKMRKEGREIKSYPIVFSDGSIFEHITGWSAKGSNPIDWYLERKDKNGKILFQKKLLYIYDKPLRAKMLMSERNFNYKGDYYLERVSTLMEMKRIQLEDDTFIMVGFIEHKKPKSIVIIRFDKDLKTKSDLINKKLYLMDESVYKKMQSPPIDDNKANKLLYEHLTNPKKGGSYGNPK